MEDQKPFSTDAADGADAIEAKLHAAVRNWFDENIRNSPVSRSTEAYNHLYQSLPDLTARLEAALKEV